MKFEKPISVTEIASLINAEVVGNKTGIVTGINEIHKVEEGDLVFVDHPKYYQKSNSIRSVIYYYQPGYRFS